MTTIDFGIDLGTTNSSIVACQSGKVRIFQSNELMNVTPSVVYLGKSGRMLVGKKAYDAWPADPLNTQAEFKRWMGFSDKLHFPAANRELSAEELSAEVLKALRADVQRAIGRDITAAVITVPAAFGALQCDATGRAAQLAGFTEAPLLQEPIAAAIAYGASAAGKSQRWMVFDLGGGTLDIAIVSTRNGRLAVLEHQGNNRLGGKDIDRLIAENVFLPPLAQQFKLPDRTQQPGPFDRLLRSLVRLAEQAKIGLSTAASVPVDIFNIGADMEGTPIESSITLERSAVETQIEPLLGQCVHLIERALRGARLAAADMDRVLLVGGPTQMPAIRNMLIATLGDKLDCSIDPMTVVAQGAALYASTLPRTSAATEAAAPAAPVPRGAVQLKLNHERASGTLQSPVAGAVTEGKGLHEIKIDAEGGVWSSGWIRLSSDRFVTDVLLSAGRPVTRFTLSGRSAAGAAVAVTPAEFAIAYMLPMASPPLPHTIAIELSSITTPDAFDSVFKRQTPLPAETRKTYRADRTLRPSESDSTLPIKFWEIEVSDDPQEKWWAGCVHIRADKLKRPLMEGAEIELTVKIDKSRKMTVDVFITSLNQGFTNDVFVPDPPTTRNQLQQQIDLCFERVEKIFTSMYAAGRDDLRERVEGIQLRLESIAEQVNEEQARGNPDPDRMLRPTDALRNLRVMIVQLEEQLESERHMSPFVIKLIADHRWTAHLVEHHGTDVDKDAMQRLGGQLERYRDAGDQRGLKFLDDQLRDLRGHILWGQPWYWESSLNYLKSPGRRFLNQAQARTLLQRAEEAQNEKNLPALRSAIVEVWKLQPPDQVEAAKEQAMQSGLKST